jgi:hypothetical protein
MKKWENEWQRDMYCLKTIDRYYVNNNKIFFYENQN